MRKKIMNNKQVEDLIVKHNDEFWDSHGEKTSCPDEQTCQALNEFLDTNPGRSFSYSLSFDRGTLALEINTLKMDAIESLRLNLRLVEFLKEELKLVKNSV